MFAIILVNIDFVLYATLLPLLKLFVTFFAILNSIKNVSVEHNYFDFVSNLIQINWLYPCYFFSFVFHPHPNPSPENMTTRNWPLKCPIYYVIHTMYNIIVAVLMDLKS